MLVMALMKGCFLSSRLSCMSLETMQGCIGILRVKTNITTL